MLILSILSIKIWTIFNCFSSFLSSARLKLRVFHWSYNSSSRMSDKAKFPQFPLLTHSEWMMEPNFSLLNSNTEFFNYARIFRWCLLHHRPKFCHSMQSTLNTIKLKKTEEETISKAMLEKNYPKLFSSAGKFVYFQ